MTATRTRTTTPRISRAIEAPRQRAYRSYRDFLETDAYAKRPPPGGYTGRAHPMGPREGGTYRTASASLHKRDVHSFGGRYVEFKPFGRIGHTGAFETDVPETEREVRVAITLAEVPSGTEVTVIQENTPAVTSRRERPRRLDDVAGEPSRLVEMRRSRHLAPSRTPASFPHLPAQAHQDVTP